MALRWGVDGRVNSVQNQRKAYAMKASVPSRNCAPPVLDTSFPARRILGLVADKWTAVVLYCLSVEDVRRFNELQRQIPDISKKMLIQTLRNLESHGLVERRIYPEVPPRTDYRLTGAGHKMREPIIALCEWAQENKTFLDDVLGRHKLTRSSMIAHPRH
jgi:DNA-binding HxlR family transcriptional regulator